MRSRGARVFDGVAGFDAAFLPRLLARPFFRLATTEELDGAYVAYQAGDAAGLIDTWAQVAAPTRAALGGLAPFYERAGWLPSLWNGLAFLASLRAVLEAGKRFRAGLAPATREALAREFPWLERRHEHVPPGWTPPLDFPPAMARFVEAGDLDEARARWQLLCALNEVQQTAYSRRLAVQFDLPPLKRHAARERALALNYLAHWSPPATRALFGQCIIILDALNAAVFELLCARLPGRMIAHSLRGTFAGRAEWRAFVAGLDRPQWLLAP
jgi:hypothetical protein